MQCPSCSAEVSDTAKFCPECGEKIDRKTVCPDCGTEAAPGSKFCAECGHKFAAVPTPGAKPATNGGKGDETETKAAIDRVFALFLENKIGKTAAQDAARIGEAAKIGSPRAMFLWAECLASPENDLVPGVARDIPAAVSWYRKAAGAGDGYGMIGLGMAYADTSSDEASESGLELDFDEADSWIDRAEGLVDEPMRLMAKMMCAIGRATAESSGEDEPPDFTEAAEHARDLLRAVDGKDVGGLPEVVRLAAGSACFLLANQAESEEEGRPLLERGAALGSEDCANALEELDGDESPEKDGHGNEEDEKEDVPGEEAGYLVEKDGYLAKRGDASRFSVSSCEYGSKDGCRHFDFTIGFSNDSDFDSGSLRLKLWFCDNDFSGGKLQGYLMCEKDFPDKSLRHGYHYEDLEIPGAERKSDPPTGDYRAVVTVSEFNEDGNWYIVAWSNFENAQHWNHEGAPAAKPGVLTDDQADLLKRFFEIARDGFAPTAFLIGREVTSETLRKFSGAAQGKIGDYRTLRKFFRCGTPIAFVDGTMFGSRKAGLLATRNGLFALNGFGGSKLCPSGYIDWDEFAGDNGCTDIVEKCNILLCRSPAVGVNLAIGDDLRDAIRMALANFRDALRDEEFHE